MHDYQDAAARLFALIEAACKSQREWAFGVRIAVTSTLAFLASEPSLARLLVLAPYEAGPVAEARHEASLSRLAALLRSGREQAGVVVMSENLEQSLLGSLHVIVARPLRRGTPEELPGLAPELTALLLAPYLGREEAARISGLTA